jgi:hypothetical protein
LKAFDLKPKQQKAISALLTAPTLKAAAAACGISEVSLWRMLQDPVFQRAYRAVRREAVERSIGELQAATSDAVATLRRNLNCGVSGVEVKAAQAILDQAIRAIELLDLEERLAALEEQLSTKQPGMRRL